MVHADITGQYYYLSYIYRMYFCIGCDSHNIIIVALLIFAIQKLSTLRCSYIRWENLNHSKKKSQEVLYLWRHFEMLAQKVSWYCCRCLLWKGYTFKKVLITRKTMKQHLKYCNLLNISNLMSFYFSNNQTFINTCNNIFFPWEKEIDLIHLPTPFLVSMSCPL